MAGKVIAPNEKPRRVVERNIALLGNLMRNLLAEPHILESLPSNFELVILPDDDPEVRLYNVNLLDILSSEGRPIVFPQLKSSRKADERRMQPSLYVPLAD